MNIHKNARLTFVRRVEMVQDVLQTRIAAEQVAGHYGVSPQTVRKWTSDLLWRLCLTVGAWGKK
jgi:transposase-like protein